MPKNLAKSWNPNQENAITMSMACKTQNWMDRHITLSMSNMDVVSSISNWVITKSWQHLNSTVYNSQFARIWGTHPRKCEENGIQKTEQDQQPQYKMPHYQAFLRPVLCLAFCWFLTHNPLSVHMTPGKGSFTLTRFWLLFYVSPGLSSHIRVRTVRDRFWLLIFEVGERLVESLSCL